MFCLLPYLWISPFPSNLWEEKSQQERESNFQMILDRQPLHGGSKPKGMQRCKVWRQQCDISFQNTAPSVGHMEPKRLTLPHDTGGSPCQLLEQSHQSHYHIYIL